MQATVRKHPDFNIFRRTATFVAQSVRGTTIEKIQQLVIEPYVKSRLRNRVSGGYSNTQIRKYLAWIGMNLLRHGNDSQFYVEMIQGDWIDGGGQQSKRRPAYARAAISRTRVRFILILDFFSTPRKSGYWTILLIPVWAVLLIGRRTAVGIAIATAAALILGVDVALPLACPD